MRKSPLRQFDPDCQRQSFNRLRSWFETPREFKGLVAEWIHPWILDEEFDAIFNES